MAARSLSWGRQDLWSSLWHAGSLVVGMWDPWLGIELGPPALGVQSFSHWTTREVPRLILEHWDWFVLTKMTRKLWDLDKILKNDCPMGKRKLVSRTISRIHIYAPTRYNFSINLLQGGWGCAGWEIRQLENSSDQETNKDCVPTQCNRKPRKGVM